MFRQYWKGQHVSNEKRQKFLFLVFTELNEHIRATDEKNVLVACSLLALIAVIATLAVDKFEVSWKYFVLSLFILIVGFCVQMLQFWYREWKEHYLKVCRSIGSTVSLGNKYLPFWMRKQLIPSSFSADKFLLLLTSFMNVGVLTLSSCLLWHLIEVAPTYKTMLAILYSAMAVGLVALTKYKLIDRRRFLNA